MIKEYVQFKTSFLEHFSNETPEDVIEEAYNVYYTTCYYEFVEAIDDFFEIAPTSLPRNTIISDEELAEFIEENIFRGTIKLYKEQLKNLFTADHLVLNIMLSSVFNFEKEKPDVAEYIMDMLDAYKNSLKQLINESGPKNFVPN